MQAEGWVFCAAFGKLGGAAALSVRLPEQSGAAEWAAAAVGLRAPEPGLEEEQGLEQEGAKGNRSTFLFHLAVNCSAFLL